jgi:N-acetylglucosaminyl-diphospho-decaprenol L-rhamnosyltransferase
VQRGGVLDLGIVLVNYNTRDLLRECLASVYDSRGDFCYGVWVVDNASEDGSAEMVACEFPQAHLIASAVNAGYACGNNLALRAMGFGAPTLADTGPAFVLLLNPDTILPPRALGQMLDFIRSRPLAGVVGPRLVLADGSLDKACRRSFPTPTRSFYRLSGLGVLFPRSRRFGAYNLTYLDSNQEAEVDSVVGAFMLLRAQAIVDAGLLDEAFFMYGEDLDWCFRIKQAGWQVRYHPDCTFLHYKRASSRQSRKAQVEFYRAMLLFYQKHYAAVTPFWLHWLVVGGVYLRAGVPLWGDAIRRARSRRVAPGGAR